MVGGPGLSAYDLPTLDKIPVIQEMMPMDDTGLALDIGIGTGYTTRAVFGSRPTVCVDIDAANLDGFRARFAARPDARGPLCVIALATALPFKSGSFRFILCSEVLEHLEDDDTAAGELARVLAPVGIAIITVPFTGLGFTSFLELLGIKTVHDFPGPERHVRRGYDVRSLSGLLARHDLVIERHAYWFRLFTRLVTDCVSVVHLLYERIVHRRRAWTWPDVSAVEGEPMFRLYALVFPALWAVSRLDRFLRSRRGFGLVALVRRRQGS